MSKVVAIKKHVRDFTSDDYQTITDLAAQNKSTKEIRELLNLDARSFNKAFREKEPGKESEVYLSFRRGIDLMNVTIDDALIQRIEDGNLTAIEIHEKRSKERKIADIVNAFFEE